ncbi:MAG: FlgD immunoglobulin-like domain containing protein [Candidatus Eisenbacteria bacterium]
MATGSQAAETYSWRYYRPGNTGIQGDNNLAIWIAPDGDPWIAGYDAIQGEGGIAKFLQSENRWFNVSNVDYPVIGSQYEEGVVVVTEMIDDGLGNLWIGTMRGALRMDLAGGPSTLERLGPWNSALPGGVTQDMSRAPDGSIWISASSSVWAGGGLTKFVPGTGAWSHIDEHGGLYIATQPKPGGGYYLWATGEGFSPMERWTSTTQTWESYPVTAGSPSHLVSRESVDADGNVWMQRWVGTQGQETLDCMRPDGTWITPPLPPMHPQVGVAALRAFGSLQALVVNGYGDLYRFDGSTWTNLGAVPHTGYIDDLEIDESGNIWLCGSGVGGAIRRDVGTGEWQRYRLTNTGQFDLFNQDIAVDPNTGDIYACANASAGVGGMVKFDGERWACFVNDLGYGLSEPWPFPGAPQSEAVHVRSSNGHVVVNPINMFTFEYDGTDWGEVPGAFDQMVAYVEDSEGRVWGMGHYGGLGIFQNGGFLQVDSGGWNGKLQLDPARAGTVWANEDWKILRTDGTYEFARAVEDFPELIPNVSTFQGLAVDADGTCWVSSEGVNGHVLYHVDPGDGSYQAWQNGLGWPFPGDHVYPEKVSPDGRLWMSYSSDFPATEHGLFWWDGTNIGVFESEPGSFFGFPDGPLQDVEVKPISGGYELWMSVIGRGIAVLEVSGSDPAAIDDLVSAEPGDLLQNYPNPFHDSTRITWSIPEAGRTRLSVFDVGGRMVRTLVDGDLSPGSHEVTWDGLDGNGRQMGNGIYFYRLESGRMRDERRMVLVR